MKGSVTKILSLLSLCFFVSCSIEVLEEQTCEDCAIDFASVATRAAIDGSFPSGTSFSVWGWYTGTKVTNQVFDRTEITNNSGNWEYTDTQFWVLNCPYDFYAVHPHDGITASVASDGTISVTNFDCSKTGAEAIDLMTAQNIGITYTGDTPPLPVDLKFSHELAKVNFVVKSEGSDVVITNISLIDAGYNGELNNGLWTITSKSIQGTPETFTNSDITLSPDGTILEVFGGDMLLIPLNETDFKCKIELEYKYLYNGIYYESGLKEISLNAGTVKSWDKGGNYKYTITIPKFTEELQLQVEVLPWDKEENASVEW